MFGIFVKRRETLRYSAQVSDLSQLADFIFAITKLENTRLIVFEK
jgi:hypothetical protein